jgi:hypothetical protein
MVMMFVGGVGSAVKKFLYYSYRRKPMGRELFVPARTLIDKAVDSLIPSGHTYDNLFNF